MRARLLLPALLASLVLSGCGSSDKAARATASATAPSDVTAATTEVKKAWADFFSGTTPQADRVARLEDGPSLTQAVALAAKDPNAKATTAVVTSVTFTDPDHADLKYDVVVAGTKALAGADGKAVRVDGRWKVSKYTFCQLLALKAGGSVPGC